MNREDVKQLIAKMYQEKRESEIQVNSAKVYKYLKSKGLTHEGAITHILEDGVKYEDLLSGILTLGIDAGVSFQ